MTKHQSVEFCRPSAKEVGGGVKALGEGPTARFYLREGGRSTRKLG